MDIERETEERIDRNFIAMEKFLNAVLADPTLLDQIPEGGMVLLAPSDDPEFSEMTTRIATEAQQRGERVHLVRFTPLPSPQAKREAS